MPFASLKLRPGVNVEATPALNEAGISRCNLIRFKSALPQKLGGWTKLYLSTVAGIPRSLHAWKDLNNTDRLAVGTTAQLGVLAGSTYTDITPQTLTTNPALNFSTTSGSAAVVITDAGIASVTTYDAIFLNTPISVGGLVLHGLYSITQIDDITKYEITANAKATGTVVSGGAVPVFTPNGTSAVSVSLAAHGRVAGDKFTFPISTTVGGVTVSGTYQVQSVPDANHFVINVDSLATGSTPVSMNSSSAQIVYYISIGPQAAGVGFGVGTYGAGGFGTGVVLASQTGAQITATNWSQDNWGEILLSCPRGGGIYYWAPNRGFTTAFLVPTAPIFNGGIFIAMPEQILVCWGSTSAAPGTTTTTASTEQFDPLLVRWSDSQDFTNFAVSSLTQAGSFSIPSGSAIIGGIQGPQQALLWTDIDLWAMQYIGPPLVFGFNKLSSGCGLIAQHAVAVMRGVVAWMGLGGFFVLSGNGVSTLPCPVWDAVFQDLDTANLDKITAAANSTFNEFWWFYPSLTGGTGEPDKYVKVNLDEGQVWDYGTLDRSAWIDQSVLGQPIGASPTGYIYQHETGNDADISPMNSWFETGWFAMSEGRDMVSVQQLHPDMKWGSFDGDEQGAITITIYATDYPNGAVRTYGPYSMTSAQALINTRLRGRLIKLRFESTNTGNFYRLGNPRYRISADGRR